MKNLNLILFLTLFLSSSMCSFLKAQSHFSEITKHNTELYKIRQVHFPDSATIIISTTQFQKGRGPIYFTENFGKSWKTYGQLGGTSNYIMAFKDLSTHVFYAVQSTLGEGLVLSTDTGRTYKQIFPGDRQNSTLYFFNDRLFIINEYGQVRISDPSFQKINSANFRLADELVFQNGKHIILSKTREGESFFSESKDGGITWESYQYRTSLSNNPLVFRYLTDSIIYTLPNERSLLYWTNNRSYSYYDSTVLPVSDTAKICDILFRDISTGYVLFDNGILTKTKDHGKHWDVIDTFDYKVNKMSLLGKRNLVIHCDRSIPSPIYISNSKLGTNEISDPLRQAIDLNISPNPSGGNMNLELTLKKSGPVMISVFNLNGQMIWQNELKSLPMGSNQIKINLKESPGIYFVKADTNLGMFTKKVLIE